MPRPLRQFQALQELADSQFGLVTSSQLTALGIHPTSVSRRLEGGMWTRLLPGVHVVGGHLAGLQQAQYGALLYAGAGSQLTGLSGLGHVGLAVPRLPIVSGIPEALPPVHVLLPHHRRRKSAGYVRIERTTRMPESPLRISGMDVAPVARAVADAARRMRRRDDVDALVAEAVQKGFATVEELQAELDLGQRRGSGLLRDALDAIAAGARSGPESDLLRLLSGADLGRLMFNVRLVTLDGRYVASPDVWLVDSGVALEVDSVEHHATGDGFERTVRRDSRYAAAGVTFLPLLPRDIRLQPDRVLGQVKQLHKAGLARQAPAVRVDHAPVAAAHDRRWRWGT